MTGLKSGSAEYRTKLMTMGRALSFFEMIRQNKSYTRVAVDEYPRAKGEERFYVTYQPVDPERTQRVVQREQEARFARAREERFFFSEAVDPATGEIYYLCNSPSSGNQYTVTEQSCSCPDYQNRCSMFEGMKCKHQVALSMVEEKGS